MSILLVTIDPGNEKKKQITKHFEATSMERNSLGVVSKANYLLSGDIATLLAEFDRSIIFAFRKIIMGGVFAKYSVQAVAWWFSKKSGLFFGISRFKKIDTVS